MTDDSPTIVSGSDAGPPPAPAPPAPPPAPLPRRTLWLLVGTGVGLLIIGAWFVAANLPKFLTAPPSSVTAVDAKAASGVDARRIQATLYYVSDDGTSLVPVGRDVLYGATTAEQARRIVEAQIQPPGDPLRSSIPAGTTVRAVFLTQTNEAFVDLGGAIVSGHQGGSLEEALTVYALVNAVTTNLPDIVSVQILVEGRQVDTLAGHLDLRYPLARATDWIRKEQ